MTKAMVAAAKNSTDGKIILSDSNKFVQSWIDSHGRELITRLSDESQKAIANLIYRRQGELMRPREMAQQIRPLIGLTDRQAQANANYREKVYNRYRDNGLSSVAAAERADKAALKYAGRQHRQRAETILHTEIAFAYNRGAFIGVRQAISNGLMGRCEMIWTTSGAHRVCSRCMELKDTVVGHTDESGVKLPPLHPRCRCAIMYREIGDKKPNKPRGLAVGNIDSTTTEGNPPKLIGKLEDMTPVTIKTTLEHYEAQIVNAPIEHAVIITRTGEIYHCNGDVHGIPKSYFEQMRHELEGAHITHNHPPGAKENDNTFSNDDFNNFNYFKMARLRGIDEKFLYELNRNAKDNELARYSLIEIYSLGLDFSDYHYAIMLKALIKTTLQWFNAESAKIYQKLNEEQGAERKLDGGNAPYRELHKEFARRMKVIGEKYGLIKEEQ